MKRVAFLFAVAVCSQLPVENRLGAVKKDIEDLLDYFIRIANEKSCPLKIPEDNKLQLEADIGNLLLTFENGTKYGEGKLAIDSKTVDLQENTLLIKTLLVWAGTQIDGRVEIVGTVRGIHMYGHICLFLEGGTLSNENLFKISHDDDSVTLDEYEIGEVKLEGLEVKSSNFESEVVTAEDLDTLIKEGYKKHITKLTSNLKKNAISFLEESKAKLKTKNLSQQLYEIWEELKKKMA